MGMAPGLGDRHRDSGRRQSYFVEESRDAETPRGTLNGIATARHRRIHVVGAMQAQDEQLSRYSAAGPVYQANLTTNPPTALPQPGGPTTVTVGDRSRHVRGVCAAGCRTRELSGGAAPTAAVRPLKTRSFPSPEESLEAPAPSLLRGENTRVKP